MGNFAIGAMSQTMLLTGNSMSSYINLNTLFGAVVVLAVIILIMVVTYFVNIKPHLNVNQENVSKDESPIDHVLAQISEHEERELVGDCELVAVITAAIYASMGDLAPADGLVVRSIRKVNDKRRINF